MPQFPHFKVEAVLMDLPQRAAVESTRDKTGKHLGSAAWHLVDALQMVGVPTESLPLLPEADW